MFYDAFKSNGYSVWNLLDLSDYILNIYGWNVLRPDSMPMEMIQFAELETLGELTKISRKHVVQCFVEESGHVPMHIIKANMESKW